MAEGWLPGHSEGGDRPSASMLTKNHKILAVMQVDSRGGVYIFLRSRGDNRATELLPQRIRARREPFGLSSVVSAICRARPLWPSAPRMGNWLPSHGGQPQGPHPARGSECTRRAFFRAKRATASISRGKSLLKNHTSWKADTNIFMLLLGSLGGLARKNIPRQ